MVIIARRDGEKFYKMADYCRPEVDTNVMSYQKVEGVEVVLDTKFGDPSSNRL